MSIVVELYQTRRTGTTRSERVAGHNRPQTWRWRATHTGNNRKLAASSEAYTNKADALNAIHQLFGPNADIQLPTP